MMTNISSSLPIELTDFDLTVPVEQPAAQQLGLANNVVALPKAKMTPPLHVFDYSGLSTAVAKEAEATAARIRDRLRAHTIETGKELLAIKLKLGHGKFGRWLDFHFGWKERTAQNYMNAAIAFGSAPRVVEILPPSTVYKLAAKSTPEALRKSVIEEICRGKTPNPKTIEKRIAELKTEARQNAKPKDGIRSKPEVGGEAHNLTTINLPVSVDLDMVNSEIQAHTASAKRIAQLLKRSLGAHYDTVRDVILRTDYATLKHALAEA